MGLQDLMSASQICWETEEPKKATTTTNRTTTTTTTPPTPATTNEADSRKARIEPFMAKKKAEGTWVENPTEQQRAKWETEKKKRDEEWRKRKAGGPQ